jgi:hypothetical protein
MAEDDHDIPLDREQLAEQSVRSAWRDLPTYDRELLENIGAAQSQVTTRPLGRAVHDLLRSAGCPGLRASNVLALHDAAGVWIAELRLVVINAAHHALENLDDASYEAMLARIAWHEWAHALSVVRATRDDVADGERLLALAPDGVAHVIRRGGYRRVEYTHELVAEIYALLMSRRRRGQRGQPGWLDNEIYDLVRRVSGWSE